MTAPGAGTPAATAGYCPGGCGCRTGTEDADARECGCDGPCTTGWETPAATTPGRAAYEAFGELGADWYPGTPWDELHEDLRAQWDAAAKAAIAAHPVVALMSVKRDAALREGRELRRQVDDLNREHDRLRELLNEAAMPLTVRPSDDVPRELAEAMAETRRYRELVSEILDAVEAISDRAGMRANVAIWRQRAGLGGLT